MPSATDIITRSLRLLGVIGAVDTPEAEDVAAGKVALDDFVDSLGLERASIFTVGRNIYPLSSGVASYTIGTGGTFNQVRPVWIDNGSVRPDRTASPILELPLGRPLNIHEWQALVKTETAGGIHRSITEPCLLKKFSIHLHLDRGRWDSDIPSHHINVDQLETAWHSENLFNNDGFNIFIENITLFVCQLLEPAEGPFQIRIREPISDRRLRVRGAGRPDHAGRARGRGPADPGAQDGGALAGC